MKWRHVVTVIAVGILGGWTNHRVEIADTFLFCADYFYDCPLGAHTLQGPGGGSDGAEAHASCQYCDPFIPCHGGCGQEEDEQVAIAHMSAIRGDVDIILAFLDDASKYITLNQSRMSVQIYGCDGKSVVANIAITDRQLRKALSQ